MRSTLSNARGGAHYTIHLTRTGVSRPLTFFNVYLKIRGIRPAHRPSAALGSSVSPVPSAAMNLRIGSSSSPGRAPKCMSSRPGPRRRIPVSFRSVRCSPQSSCGPRLQRAPPSRGTTLPRRVRRCGAKTLLSLLPRSGLIPRFATTTAMQRKDRKATRGIPH